MPKLSWEVRRAAARAGGLSRPGQLVLLWNPVLCALCLLAAGWAAAGTAPPRDMASTGGQAFPAAPPAELVRLDNPSQAAILRHEIEAFLDPPTHMLRATDRVTVLHAPGVPADLAFSFLLWKELGIETATGESVPVQVEETSKMNPRSFWRRPPYEELEGYGRARQVNLRPASGTAPTWPETLRFTLEYSGFVMDSLKAPRVAYARSFETTDGLIEERGAFLSSSSFWIPTRPEEVFTFSVTADLPPDWRAVSQGRLSATATRYESANGARRLDTWDCPHPMDEVYLVAGPWTLHEMDHNGVAVQAFTYEKTDSTVYNRYLDGTGRYLDLYGGLIGPYPFAKFALVENFWQSGFGMPSFTLLGDRVIRLPFILDTSYGHEILHNWWGNGVFVDAETGNWCEGLTTYGADYLYKERESREAARQYRLNALSGYLDYVSTEEDVPLSRFRERHDFATQAIGYSKSMMVIHQLRRQAGNERFWEALRDFYRRNLWRRASWVDLLASFHRVAGVRPEPFLKQWIDRAGAPLVDLSGVSCVRVGKAWEVMATLSQTLPDGTRNGDPFSVDVPVRLEWEAGGDSTWQVPLAGWDLAWSVRVPRRPARLRVDPDFEVMRRIHRSEIPPTLSRTLGSDSVTAVIASGLNREMETACRALADEWAKGQALTTVMEASLPEGWIPPTSAWYLGLGPAAKRLLEGLAEVKLAAGNPGGSGWNIAGKTYGPGASVVLTGAFAGLSDRSWSVVAAAEPAQVAVVGAKVPHYGKYSYLVFEGGKNIGQGVWTEVDSPLVADLAAGSGQKAVDRRGRAR